MVENFRQDPNDPWARIRKMREEDAPAHEQWFEFTTVLAGRPDLAENYASLGPQVQAEHMLEKFGVSDPKDFFKTPEAAQWDEDTLKRMGTRYLSTNEAFNALPAGDPMRRELHEKFYKNFKKHHSVAIKAQDAEQRVVEQQQKDVIAVGEKVAKQHLKERRDIAEGTLAWMQNAPVEQEISEEMVTKILKETGQEPKTPEEVAQIAEQIRVGDEQWDKEVDEMSAGFEGVAGDAFRAIAKTEYGKGVAIMAPDALATLPETLATWWEAASELPGTPEAVTESMKSITDPLFKVSDAVRQANDDLSIIPKVGKVEDIKLTEPGGFGRLGQWFAFNLGQQSVIIPGIAGATAAAGPAGGLTAATVLQTGFQNQEIRDMGEHDPAKASVIGLATGAMEFLPIGHLMSRVTRAGGPGFKNWVFGKMKGMSIQTLEEGMTEGAQTFTEKLGLAWVDETYDFLSKDARSEIWNAIVAGAAMGGTTGSLSRVQNKIDGIVGDSLDTVPGDAAPAPTGFDPAVVDDDAKIVGPRGLDEGL
jgi:hypothetical protein